MHAYSVYNIYMINYIYYTGIYTFIYFYVLEEGTVVSTGTPLVNLNYVELRYFGLVSPCSHSTVKRVYYLKRCN